MNEPTEEKPNRSGAVASIIMLSIMIYLLSIGPAVKILRAHPYLEPTFARVYAPVEFLYKKVRFTQKPIDAYLRLWV